MSSEETWKTRDKSVAWFHEKPQISPSAFLLLEAYSQIPANEVIDHVVNVRNDAWEVFPYPCIGQFLFLDLSLKEYEEYGEVLERLGQGQTFLDMGCCFGQEIRQLTADGVPSENLFGCDLEKNYHELGYRLFNDRDRLHAKFLTASIFDNDSALTNLNGTFDIVYAGSFLHLFGYTEQVTAAKAIAALLRPQKGSMLLGRQIGATKAVAVENPADNKRTMFQHSAESFESMWKDIGEQLGITFTVQATLSEVQGRHKGFLTSDMRLLHFIVRRQ
ncbi:hypothetical protein P280DRAFT_281267 [Massarina eburnea CBS 473.64]|uniref:Methyltransferase domain-containing protein n=1 Tax=Massarina eburnea CBS 473.64 TaxID=1395130 RepID=A0A6A6S284_9PLEO|nr:hypothetical protein P280DRAFT_281267 [Massarina eburnea CBS 473.64]